MGLMALGLGLWVLLYLAVHRGLDPASQGVGLVTVAICVAFGVYVLVRRIRRGPQH
jgi:hypothetical protein